MPPQTKTQSENRTIYNQVILQGRLGRDPDIKHFQSGAMLAEFSLSLYQGKNEDGTYKPSTWVDCKAWSSAAEALNLCTKGNEVAIEGKFAHDEWDDRETGKKRKRLYVLVFKVQRVEKEDRRRGDSDNSGEFGGGDRYPQNNASNTVSDSESDSDDDYTDIPF